MCILCRACLDTEKLNTYGHTPNERCLTGTWVCVELLKVVAIGYVIVAICDETTLYDQTTSEGGLLAQYMNTFMKIKMDASGYPVGCTTPQDKRITSSA